MTNKLVVIINSLKVPKIEKTLLYEMKFIVPNYSCLQNPRIVSSGSFANLRKATIAFAVSIRPSVRPHGTIRLPLDGVS